MRIRWVAIIIYEGDYHISAIQLDVKSKTFVVIEEGFFFGIPLFHFKELVSHPLTSTSSREYSMKEVEQQKNNWNNQYSRCTYSCIRSKRSFLTLNYKEKKFFLIWKKCKI